jgi:hypothetical protein
MRKTDLNPHHERPRRWWTTHLDPLSGQEALTSTIDVYRGIIEDLGTSYDNAGDQPILVLHESIAADLIEIERFMRYSLYGPFDTAFRNRRGELYRESPEQRYRLYFYRLFHHWTWLDITPYVVSPMVRLFFETLDDLGLRFLSYTPTNHRLVWTDHPDLRRLNNLHEGRLDRHADLYDLLIRQMREALKGPAYEGFHRRCARRVLLALRHHRASLRFISGLLQQTPKLRVSRLEFGYRHAHTDKPTAAQSFEQLNRLITTELTGPNGPDHLAYLWHADYSAIRGHYFQLFWFDQAEGSRSPSGESLVQRLSRQWTQDITQGAGYAIDCATSHSPYRNQFEAELGGPGSLAGSSLDWSLLYLFRKPLYYALKGICSHGINCLPVLPELADDELAPVLRANSDREPLAPAGPVIPEPESSLWTM